LRKHLHIASQNDEVAIVFPDQRELPLLDLLFVLLRDRQEEIRDAIKIGHALAVGVIGDDQRNLALQFAALMPIEQVLEAVIVFRDKDRNAVTVGRTGETPVHLVVAGHGREALGKLRKVEREAVEIELNAREEQIRFLVSVLVVREDIGIVAENEVGNGSDHALAVGAGDKKDGGIM